MKFWKNYYLNKSPLYFLFLEKRNKKSGLPLVLRTYTLPTVEIYYRENLTLRFSFALLRNVALNLGLFETRITGLKGLRNLAGFSDPNFLVWVASPKNFP